MQYQIIKLTMNMIENEWNVSKSKPKGWTWEQWVVYATNPRYAPLCDVYWKRMAITWSALNTLKAHF